MRLHLRDEGPRAAPVLLLPHGFGSSLQTWDGWAAELSQTYRTVRFDLPGVGLSGPDPRDARLPARSWAYAARISAGHVACARACVFGVKLTIA